MLPLAQLVDSITSRGLSGHVLAPSDCLPYTNRTTRFLSYQHKAGKGSFTVSHLHMSYVWHAGHQWSLTVTLCVDNQTIMTIALGKTPKAMVENPGSG